MSRTQANLILLLAGAMWGMGFVAQSTAMEHVGPFLFIGLRFVVGAVAILPFALVEARRAPRPLSRREWQVFAFIGVILFAGMASQQVGLMTTSVTNSGFLTGLYVVMVPFLAVLIYREWPHPVIWPCAFAALAGIFLLSGGDIGALATGDWLTMVCALCWAFQMIFIARYAPQTSAALMKPAWPSRCFTRNHAPGAASSSSSMTFCWASNTMGDASSAACRTGATGTFTMTVRFSESALLSTQASSPLASRTLIHPSSTTTTSSG